MDEEEEDGGVAEQEEEEEEGEEDKTKKKQFGYCKHFDPVALKVMLVLCDEDFLVLIVVRPQFV